MSPILFFIFTACDSNLIESNINDSDEKNSTCDINILESNPFPDSTNAYYRYPIQVLLSDNDPTASLSVTTSETEVSALTHQTALNFFHRPASTHAFTAHSTAKKWAPEAAVASRLGEPGSAHRSWSSTPSNSSASRSCSSLPMSSFFL